MPNVMAALPNIGGALCSTPQSLADTHYLYSAVQCSNTAKRQNLVTHPDSSLRYRRYINNLLTYLKPVEIYWGAPNLPTDLSR